MNTSRALGPDEFHPRVLKELVTELGHMFAHLFQQSVDTSEIPKEWSLANICCFFKKSDVTCVQLSPGFLDLCTLQVTQHIVCSNIMAHLDGYKLLSDRQHAFRKSSPGLWQFGLGPPRCSSSGRIRKHAKARSQIRDR